MRASASFTRVASGPRRVLRTLLRSVASAERFRCRAKCPGCRSDRGRSEQVRIAPVRPRESTFGLRPKRIQRPGPTLRLFRSTLASRPRSLNSVVRLKLPRFRPSRPVRPPRPRSLRSRPGRVAQQCAQALAARAPRSSEQRAQVQVTQPDLTQQVAEVEVGQGRVAQAQRVDQVGQVDVDVRGCFWGQQAVVERDGDGAVQQADVVRTVEVGVQDGGQTLGEVGQRRVGLQLLRQRSRAW